MDTFYLLLECDKKGKHYLLTDMTKFYSFQCISMSKYEKNDFYINYKRDFLFFMQFLNELYVCNTPHFLTVFAYSYKYDFVYPGVNNFEFLLFIV